MNFKLARNNHTTFAQAKRNTALRIVLGLVLVFLALFGFYYNGPGQVFSRISDLVMFLVLGLGLLLCLLGFQSAFNARARNPDVDGDPYLQDYDK